MKTPIRFLLVLLAGAISWPLGAAEHPRKMRVLADKDAPPGKTTRHVMIRHGEDEPAERETVAFIGVETARISPALTVQLGLQKNVGLLVREVVAKSPAAGALQRHDVLLKMDDQWLIEARQFSVLVRNHQPGDEVTLTYVRAGKQATATVKLGQHDVPKLALGGPEHSDDVFEYTFDAPFPMGGARHVLPLLRHEQPGMPADHVRVPGPGLRGTAVAADNSNLVFSDERGSIELTVKQGKKTLVAKNTKGDELYSGPVDTEEERAKLPPVVKQQLDEVEGMHEFSFQPGPDFGENVKFVRPDARQISLPLPPPAPLEPEPAL